MPRYTPEFIAHVQRDYETTDKTLAAIAVERGISERGINRMRDREGWQRRSDRPPRGLPAAVRLLDEATTLLAAQGGQGPQAITETATGSHPPLEGEGRRTCEACEPGWGEVAIAAATGRSPHPVHTFAALGANDPPPPLEGEVELAASPAPTRQESALAAADRIERLVHKELAAEEAVRARLGTLPRIPADAERTARTLSTLTQTLHALARLRAGHTSDSGSYDDADMPRDIDEFRLDLARRIDAFVASRTEPRLGPADSGPETVDEIR